MCILIQLIIIIVVTLFNYGVITISHFNVLFNLNVRLISGFKDYSEHYWKSILQLNYYFGYSFK